MPRLLPRLSRRYAEAIAGRALFISADGERGVCGALRLLPAAWCTAPVAIQRSSLHGGSPHEEFPPLGGGLPSSTWPWAAHVAPIKGTLRAASSSTDTSPSAPPSLATATPQSLADRLKLVKSLDRVEHIPLIEPVKTTASGRPCLQAECQVEIRDSATCGELLDALQRPIALGVGLSAENVVGGVQRLCGLLGKEETTYGRWSALTLDKTFQASGLWETSQEGSRAADILSAAAVDLAPTMPPKALAAVIEGLAAAGGYNLQLLRVSEKLLEPHTSSLDRDVLVALVVAWAEAGLRPTHSFLEAAASSLLDNLLDCSSDDLSGILLGYAKLQYCHDALLDAVAKAVMSSLVNHYDSMTGVLLDAVAEVLISDVSKFEPKDISRLMWTFAELGHPHHRMIEVVLRFACGRLDKFNAKGLANLVWGAARTDEAMNDNVAKLLFGIGNCAVPHIEEFSGQDLANLMWSYAHLRYYHEPLLIAVGDHMHQHLVDLQPKQLTRLILSFARLNHRPNDTLLEDLAYFVSFNLPKMDSVSAVRSVWSLGVLGALNEEVFSKFCQCAAEMNPREFEVRHQIRLMDLEMMAARLPVKEGSAQPQLPQSIREEALLTTQQSVLYNSVLLTSLQREIMTALITKGVPYKMEAITANGCIKVDLAIEYDGQQIALEVANRRRYSCNEPFRPLGRLLLRERLLSQAGWKVMQVSTHDWERLPTLSSKMCYLQRLMDAAVGKRPNAEGAAGAAAAAMRPLLVAAEKAAMEEEERAAAEVGNWWFF